jgi:hyaluronan synthase
MYFCSIYQQSIAILITVGVGIIKSLYGVIKTKNIRFLFFYLYSFVYFFTIIPAKITALVTLWDMSWGTRGKTVSWVSTYWSFIIWISTMTGGFAYTIYKNHVFDISNQRYLIAFVGWMTFVGFVLITCIIEFVYRKLKKCSNELERDILNERKVIKVNK